MTKKKSLIIFPGYFLPHIGGLETHVDEFCKYLSKLKQEYSVYIFAPNIPKSLPCERIHKTVKVVRYPAFELISNYPVPKFWNITFWKQYFWMFGKHFDFVMTRTRFFSNSFLGLILAKFRFRRIKLIHVEHGSSFVKLNSSFKSFLAYVYDMIFSKILLFFSDKIIAISDASYLFLRKDFRINPKKMLKITRGVDFEIYDTPNKSLADFSKELKKKFRGKKIISFAGRFYEWKGVINSIKAYKKLPKSLQNKTVFLIVGYGEDEVRLKKEAGNFLDKGIYFLGKKSFLETIEILKITNLYIHSAYKGGGLSNSLLQAMYLECAVLASPHEGAREVVNDSCGILLNGNSSEKLRTGLVTLLNYKDDKLLKLGKVAKKIIKKDFNWKDKVEEYLKVLK